MKYLMLPLFALLALASCKKRYCWECTHYNISTAPGSQNNPPETGVRCDMTEEQIRDYERSETDTLYAPMGQSGVRYYRALTVVCERQ